MYSNLSSVLGHDAGPICFNVHTSLKRFIARRGRPRKIYSDNEGTFIKTAIWIDTLRREERLQVYLDEFDIEWQFNLSGALWWGGQL